MSPSSLCCVTNALDVFLYLQELYALLIRISNNTHINTKRERERERTRRRGRRRSFACEKMINKDVQPVCLVIVSAS